MRLHAFLLLLLATAFSETAAAQSDFARTSVIDSVGIGANATLGGSNGVHVRYFVTPNVGLVLTLGLDTLDQSADGSGTERYDVTLDSAIYGQFRLLTWDRGAFGVQTGLDFGLGIASSDDDTVTHTDFALAGGFFGEWFVSKLVSLFTSGGIRVALLDDEDAARLGASGTDAGGVAFDLSADLFGSAGFTLWFK